MKTLKIKKIEKDGDFFSLTLDINPRNEIEKGDFDFDQLGDDIVFINSFRDTISVAGNVTLKAGDSITDDFGGQPILGQVRTDAVEKNMSIVKESDYRDAFQNKHFGK